MIPKIDPNAPAFPVPLNSGESLGGGLCSNGLTIRAELAARFMAAIIAKSQFERVEADLVDDVEAEAALGAIAYADALIAELNNEIHSNES